MKLGPHHAETQASCPTTQPPGGLHQEPGGGGSQGHLLPAPTNQPQKSLILSKSPPVSSEEKDHGDFMHTAPV